MFSLQTQYNKNVLINFMKNIQFRDFYYVSSAINEHFLFITLG